MKFISYLKKGRAHFGVVLGDRVADIGACLDQPPPDVQAFAALAGEDPSVLEQVAAKSASAATVSLHSLALLPCVPRPGKIVCLGVNYHDHAAEGGNKVADYPTIFFRGPTSLLAHEGTIPIPAVSDKLDFEAELAVVIGKPARNVNEDTALEHVFAYACFNDATFRDFQRKTTQWTVGKNFDATGGFGPWLVTADELPAGCRGLRIESRLNGQVMQSASTTDMVFHVAATLSMMSQCMTLESGDVIVMGTPAGVGYARNPPVWMKAGDIIEVEIERIGILRNRVSRA